MKLRVSQRFGLHLVSLGSAQKILIQTCYLCIQTCFSFPFLLSEQKVYIWAESGHLEINTTQYTSVITKLFSIILLINVIINSKKKSEGGRFVGPQTWLLNIAGCFGHSEQKQNILECSPLMDSR